MTTSIIGNKILVLNDRGYIAGSGDGIVTINGTPASRSIYLYEVGGGLSIMTLIARQASLPNGHYLFMGLNPVRQYLIMARDNKGQYEPFCWDYVTPATDLTIAEQQQLWDSLQ